MPMDSGRSLLGRCPRCGSQIESDQLLIKYEDNHERTRLFAECPACTDVVHPV